MKFWTLGKLLTGILAVAAITLAIGGACHFALRPAITHPKETLNAREQFLETVTTQESAQPKALQPA